MQDLKRLQVGAYITNSAAGFPSVELVPFDGGDFNLAPKKLDDGLILVDPNRPAGYGIQIVGEAASLKQFANALLAIARKQEGGADDGAAPEREDA